MIEVIPGSYGTFGVSCAGPTKGTTVTMSELTSPRIGRPFMLLFRNLPASTRGFVIFGLSDRTWGLQKLPIDIVGGPGCRLLVSMEITFALPPVSSTIRTFQVPIPNQASLVGREFLNQGVFHAPGNNAIGPFVTNGGRGRIGK